MGAVIRCLVVVVMLAIPAGNALAGTTMQLPKVEYSADSIMEAGDMTMRSRVFYAPGKQRLEQNVSGSGSVIIHRMDRDLAWVLMPEQKSYMEMSLAEGKKKSKDLYDCSVEMKKIGSETVNGQRTTKSKITASCPEEAGYEGTIWVTGDGIMMKMVAESKGGETKGPVKMELKNLKIARQDPKLFEVPAGYNRFDLGGMLEGLKNFKLPADPQAERPGKTKDEGRSYTAAGRSYTASQQVPGRSYTARDRNEGRSYTANQKDTGRSYTEKSRSTADPVVDTVNKVRRWIGF